MIKPQAQHVQLCMMGSIDNVVSDPNIHSWRTIMWTKPAVTEMRFGFEVTMYVCNR
jgi:pyrroloquinoline quinone biosynthesis protein A